MQRSLQKKLNEQVRLPFFNDFHFSGSNIYYCLQKIVRLWPAKWPLFCTQHKKLKKKKTKNTHEKEVNRP